MKGVFLHILADTLGSVGVIVSASKCKISTQRVSSNWTVLSYVANNCTILRNCRALFLLVLMWAFDWMIADPICSIFIAILIAISVWGLIKESVQILMQRQPLDLDHQLPEACSKVNIYYF